MMPKFDIMQCKQVVYPHSLIKRTVNIIWQYDHAYNVLSLILSLTMLRTERSCGNPGTPDNGGKNSSAYQYGNAISFTCNVGYTMQGSQVRTCQTNGEWTGTQPTCTSKLDSFYHVLFDNGDSSPNPFLCDRFLFVKAS